MIENKKITSHLQKVNVSIMIFLSFLILTSLFLAFTDSWRYLPVFKFYLTEADKDLSIFVHAFMFDINLGFFFQLFVLIFSWMIFFSTKRNISFQMIYVLIIIRSILILIQDSTLSVNYILKNGDSYIKITQIFYLCFFIVLFILNKIYDTKKAPRNGASYQ